MIQLRPEIQETIEVLARIATLKVLTRDDLRRLALRDYKAKQTLEIAAATKDLQFLTQIGRFTRVKLLFSNDYVVVAERLALIPHGRYNEDIASAVKDRLTKILEGQTDSSLSNFSLYKELDKIQAEFGSSLQSMDIRALRETEGLSYLRYMRDINIDLLQDTAVFDLRPPMERNGNYPSRSLGPKIFSIEVNTSHVDNRLYVKVGFGETAQIDAELAAKNPRVKRVMNFIKYVHTKFRDKNRDISLPFRGSGTVHFAKNENGSVIPTIVIEKIENFKAWEAAAREYIVGRAARLKNETDSMNSEVGFVDLQLSSIDAPGGEGGPRPALAPLSQSLETLTTTNPIYRNRETRTTPQRVLEPWENPPVNTVTRAERADKARVDYAVGILKQIQDGSENNRRAGIRFQSMGIQREDIAEARKILASQKPKPTTSHGSISEPDIMNAQDANLQKANEAHGNLDILDSEVD